MQILKTYQAIKINCHGGILSLERLEKVVDILSTADVYRLKFGLRQNIFIEFSSIDSLPGSFISYPIRFSFQGDCEQLIFSNITDE